MTFGVSADSFGQGAYSNLGYSFACHTSSYGETDCNKDFVGANQEFILAKFEMWVTNP